jgi:hypothetical protein
LRGCNFSDLQTPGELGITLAASFYLTKTSK